MKNWCSICVMSKERIKTVLIVIGALLLIAWDALMVILLGIEYGIGSRPSEQEMKVFVIVYTLVGASIVIALLSIIGKFLKKRGSTLLVIACVLSLAPIGKWMADSQARKMESRMLMQQERESQYQPDYVYQIFRDAYQNPTNVEDLTIVGSAMSHSFFMQAPEGIGSFINLKALNFAAHCVEDLPEEFGNLQKLIWLSLASNRLTTVPTPVLELESLEELRLMYNNIESLPPELAQLPNLHTIDISCNLLSDEEIANFQKLRPDITIINKEQRHPLRPWATTTLCYSTKQHWDMCESSKIDDLSVKIE